VCSGGSVPDGALDRATAAGADAGSFRITVPSRSLSTWSLRRWVVAAAAFVGFVIFVQFS